MLRPIGHIADISCSMAASTIEQRDTNLRSLVQSPFVTDRVLLSHRFGCEGHRRMKTHKPKSDTVRMATECEPLSAGRDAKIVYGNHGTATTSFQRARLCKTPFADVVAQLRAAIVSADLWVIHEIDLQMLLRRGGFAIGSARQILFFHARFMARLLTIEPAALPEVPLKFGIIDQPNGEVIVRWTDPAVAFARYGSNALSDLGQELGMVCTRIAVAALGPSST
jgi:uncharacterized protein (DUF302 family)